MSNVPVRITIPMRRVARAEGGYQVEALETTPIDGNVWLPKSKVYAHSTSAFAALGRLTQTSIGRD